MSWSVRNKITADELSQELLCKRETSEILLRVCEGDTNKEIGEDMGLKENAINSRLHRVYKTLGVRNKTQLGFVVGLAAGKAWRR